MGTKHQVSLRERAAADQAGLCYYCGLPMWSKSPANLAAQFRLSLKNVAPLKCTAEHLQARSHDGPTSATNIVAAHSYCNLTRHRRRKPQSPEAFRARVERAVARGSWLTWRILTARQLRQDARPGRIPCFSFKTVSYGNFMYGLRPTRASRKTAPTYKHDDIIRDIVTPKKLRKLKSQLVAMAASPRGLRSDELLSLAKKLGRTKSKRGKEPTWIREDQPELSPPLSIPNHSKELKSGTARSIIDALLSDVDVWELHLAEVEDPDHDEEDDESDVPI